MDFQFTGPVPVAQLAPGSRKDAHAASSSNPADPFGNSPVVPFNLQSSSTYILPQPNALPLHLPAMEPSANDVLENISGHLDSPPAPPTLSTTMEDEAATPGFGLWAAPVA